MKVDQATVHHIASLARLKITKSEAKNLEKELTSILNWIEQLNEVNTDNISPMKSVVDTSMKQRNDEVASGNMPEAILKNAPKSEDNYFMVPKVVE